LTITLEEEGGRLTTKEMEGSIQLTWRLERSKDLKPAVDNDHTITTAVTILETMTSTH
jgi:hypothetical protein